MDSKANWVMRSLLQGWTAPGDHFWGFINDNESQIKDLTTQGKDWYFWDMPYYGRWYKDTTEDYYWRASRNSIHYSHTKDYPSDRFKQWNVAPREYGTGSKILICPSSETMTRYTTGMDVKMWVSMITMALQKYTDRYIEVRYKPRANGTSGPAAATIPFEEQARDTHCVVTCISLAAIDAQILGIPTICHPSSFAADISSTKLEEIENPRRVDRQQWFNNLAYSQFTHTEIENGFAQEILNA
jgi:hypothetical protein